VELAKAAKQSHNRGGGVGKIHHGVWAEESRQGTQGCLGRVDRAGVVRINDWSIVTDTKM
jgi:hypothetical protein